MARHLRNREARPPSIAEVRTSLRFNIDNQPVTGFMMEQFILASIASKGLKDIDKLRYSMKNAVFDCLRLLARGFGDGGLVASD
jgi:hypothetical protein